VYYSNGTLKFSEPVNNITVYTVYGALMAQFPGNHTEISVNLNQGLYIVQAGNKSAKLLVNTNGIGGTTVQPVLKTPTAYASPPPEINLRAGGGIKIYWNITTGNSVVPVEIFEVVNFKFTADNSIVFTLKNGTTVELENYQGIEFSIEPAPVTTTSKWDMEKTLKFGGATYVADFVSHDHLKYISVIAVSKDHVIADIISLNSSVTVAIKDITYGNFWNIDGKLSCINENAGIIITMSTQIYIWSSKSIFFYTYTNPYQGFDQDKAGSGYYGVAATKYPGETNIIPTTFKLNTDNSLTMVFVLEGKTYTRTLYAP
jgi:hypothetical protein